MKSIDKAPFKYSIPEKFFVEKIMELLDTETIDTYRARIMNPRTIIIECSELIKERLRGRIPNQKAIIYAAEEAKKLIADEDKSYLNFSPFSHATILSNVGNLYHEDNSPNLTPQLLKKILINLKNFSLNHNKDYASYLFKVVEVLIKDYNNGVTIDGNEVILEQIATISTYLVTELLYKGYTKKHLLRKVNQYFNHYNTTDFRTAFLKFRKLLDFKESSYQIVFKIDIPSEVVANLEQFPDAVISNDLNEYHLHFTEDTKAQVISFVSKVRKSIHFYKFEIEANDSFEALNKARIKFAEILDLIHLGYSEHRITIIQKILVVHPNPNGNYYFDVKDYQYELDGTYQDGNELYKSFIKGITTITLNSDIKSDTKEKIKSAIRYLRLGNNAIEVEHKFINYWIALEYLFSDTITDNQGTTINKIKKIFPKIHSNIFIQRLIKDFHDNIISLGLKKNIPFFSEDYSKYLFTNDSYDWIINNAANENPLLAFRAIKLKKILFSTPPIDKKSSCPVEDRLLRHKNDLELHLARMYRIRNSIIHDAAIGKNIISITANLKYYLIFIIAHIIKALEENNALRSIEDLFALEENIFDSLEKERFPIEKLLSIGTHFEIVD